LYEETKKKYSTEGLFKYKMNKLKMAEIIANRAVVWAEKEGIYKKFGF